MDKLDDIHFVWWRKFGGRGKLGVRRSSRYECDDLNA